jgi:hypothetical protein
MQEISSGNAMLGYRVLLGDPFKRGETFTAYHKQKHRRYRRFMRIFLGKLFQFVL